MGRNKAAIKLTKVALINLDNRPCTLELNSVPTYLPIQQRDFPDTLNANAMDFSNIEPSEITFKQSLSSSKGSEVFLVDVRG